VFAACSESDINGRTGNSVEYLNDEEVVVELRTVGADAVICPSNGDARAARRDDGRTRTGLGRVGWNADLNRSGPRRTVIGGANHLNRWELPDLCLRLTAGRLCDRIRARASYSVEYTPAEAVRRR